MAQRRTWEDIGGVANAIIKGEHDDDLWWISQACGQRLKRVFRKGQRVKVVGTDNPALYEKMGTVKQVNPKTIGVDVEGVGRMNFSPNLLQAVPAGGLTEVPLREVS